MIQLHNHSYGPTDGCSGCFGCFTCLGCLTVIGAVFFMGFLLWGMILAIGG